MRDPLRALYSELKADHWPFPLEYHSLAPGESIALLGRTIRGFAAHHMRDGTALCLRIESEGKVIAFPETPALSRTWLRSPKAPTSLSVNARWLTSLQIGRAHV